MVTRRWPVAHDSSTARFNDVADGAQCVTEVFCVIFLVTTTEQRDQLTVEVNFFQGWEEIVPVTLRFAVVPGRATQQQDVIALEIFFAALGDVVHIGNVFTELFLNVFCDIFGIAGITAEENADDCHE